jgi:hypothetical protein
MMMSVEQSVDSVTGEFEILEINLLQCRFVHLTWARTQAAAMGRMRLTSWAVTRPYVHLMNRRFLLQIAKNNIH